MINEPKPRLFAICYCVDLGEDVVNDPREKPLGVRGPFEFGCLTLGRQDPPLESTIALHSESDRCKGREGGRPGCLIIRVVASLGEMVRNLYDSDHLVVWVNEAGDQSVGYGLRFHGCRLGGRRSCLIVCDESRIARGEIVGKLRMSGVKYKIRCLLGRGIRRRRG